MGGTGLYHYRTGKGERQSRSRVNPKLISIIFSVVCCESITTTLADVLIMKSREKILHAVPERVCHGSDFATDPHLTIMVSQIPLVAAATQGCQPSSANQHKSHPDTHGYRHRLVEKQNAKYGTIDDPGVA